MTLPGAAARQVASQYCHLPDCPGEPDCLARGECYTRSQLYLIVFAKPALLALIVANWRALAHLAVGFWSGLVCFPQRVDSAV